MVSAKCLAILLVAGLAQAQENVIPEENARQAPTVAPSAIPHWTESMRVAVNGASQRLAQNMVVVLGGLAETSREAGLNGTRAFAHLTRAIITNTIDLTGVVAYMPRLLLLDLPNQFTEVLSLVRRNEVRVPSSVNEAIDNILVLTRQAETSGITQRLFGPIIKFMPNILNGAHDFLQQIFTTMFTVFGAGPLPAPVVSPIPSRSESDNVVVAEPAPVPAAGQPASRYYHHY